MKHKDNSRKVWQFMKEVIGKLKTKSNTLPQTMKVNNENLYDEKDIAFEFYRYFTNVGPYLAEKFLLLRKILKNIHHKHNLLDDI